MSRGGGLAAGLATFNSCNKAGSIPHFTKHLQSNPTDYNALMWRGRAHSIVGNISSARADFIAAGNNSSGARRYVAQYFEASMNQDGAESIKILNQAVGRYPENPLVLGEIGTVFYMNNQYTDALPILEKTVWLLEQGGTIEEPSYCWHKHNIGSIYLQNNQLDAAERAFADALNFSETHTVSHIGYAQVQLAKRKEDIARRHYNRARHLNPTLVTWETFEAFKAAVQPAKPATWFETFKNLPWTLGNMALSAAGMNGTSQPAPAPTRPSSSTRPASANQPNYQSGANRSALQANSNQATTRSSTSQSSHTSANQSSYGTSSNKPTYRPTYTSSANQSTYKPAANSSTYSASSSQQTNRPRSQTNDSYTHSGRSTSQSASRPRTAPSASNRDSFSTYRSESQTTPQNYQLTSSSANRASFTSTPTGSRQYSTPTASRPYSTDTFSRAGGVGSNDNVTTIEAAKKSRANRQNASQAAGTSRSSGASNMAGGSRRSGGGSGNGGDGGGSDDDDDASNDAWKRIRKLSKEILKYGGKEYVLSEDEKFYYSRDKAGHGSSYLKMYHNKKNRLEFIGSLNRNFDLLEGKHESREGTSIRKADMDVVRRR